MDNDPVFQMDGLWFFWDETWAHKYGPFRTEQEARKQLGDYYDNVLDGNMTYRENMAEKDLKQYEFEVISTVIKRCTVEAFSESEAKVKMFDWDVIDEQDVSMTDWGVTKGPDLIC